MEREIRAWWNELTTAQQRDWMAAWEDDTITDEVVLTLPGGWANTWITETRRPGPTLEDFLEKQAAERFLAPDEIDI